MGVAFFIVAESVWAVKFSKLCQQAQHSRKPGSATDQTPLPLQCQSSAGNIALDQRPQVSSNMPVQKLGQLGFADRANHLVDHLPVLE
jgi:hypothetical protein